MTRAAAAEPFADATKALLRDRLLGAVHDLLADRPWEKVSMAAVAGAAGVSRQTVYNTYGTRDELALAYVLWQAEQFLDGVADAIRAAADLPGAFSASLAVFLDGAADHPVLRAAARGDHSGLLALLASSQGAPVVDFAVERIVAAVAERFPDVAGADVVPAAEVSVRLALSQVTMPTGAPATEVVASVDRILAPYLRSLG